MTSEDVFLDDTWCLWFHDPNSEDWSKESYRRLGECSTVAEFTQLFTAFEDLFSRGMFFLMRSHILPVWEDPANIQGGAFSFRIPHEDVARVWFRLTADLLSEALVAPSVTTANPELVCGVSIAPKRGCCIMRVWVSDRTKNTPAHYTWTVPSYTAVLFKPHGAAEAD